MSIRESSASFSNPTTTRFFLTKSEFEVEAEGSEIEGRKQNYKCDVDEFLEILKSTTLSPSEFDKLKLIVHEMYISVKENPSLEDIALCRNAEVRRNMIKNIGYENVKRNAKVIDKFGSYELFDLSANGKDLGRWCKMLDSTTDRLYILHVPRERDMGRVKIPIDTCQKAIAWSFSVSPKEYRPIAET